MFAFAQTYLWMSIEIISRVHVKGDAIPSFAEPYEISNDRLILLARI